ncbi:LacI family DNA-binding transcriptional regulator [Pseudactinotalea sp. Z1732]|uniref:LacI family DNA-binding transcriptional regulator n=2 Tax=Micrococcales TaxID=85006 RepID=UPI003C7C588D
MSNGNRLTIADLARRLGLSPAAVSYALNNRPGVSQETRDRVQALARDLGWYPSSSARALSKARTGSIGMVLSRDPEMIGTEPYYMQIIAGVEHVLIEADMSLTLRMVSPQSGADLAIYSRWAAERRVDGVILFDEHVDDPRLPLLTRLGLPAVLQGGPATSSTIRSIETDDRAVAELIVDAFAALGHRYLTYLTGPLRMMHERHRLAQVGAQAERRGMSIKVIEGDYTMAGAHSLISEQLRTGPVPSAITCSNDLMSVGTLQAAEEARVSVPGDLSLISWDDSLLCSVSRPAITAVDRHPVEYGIRTAQALLHLIRGGTDTTEELTPSQMVLRGTTGPAPGWVPAHNLGG